MLSNDCKKRVTVVLIALILSMAAFICFAFLGSDLFMDIPKDIQLK